jgi:hypothetical protein
MKLGTINPPLSNSYFDVSNNNAGFFLLISNILKFLGAIAGIYFVFQLIISGYLYLSSNGDPKKTEQAWAKIWQSLLGLIIISGAVLLSSLIGKLVGIDILNPEIYGPTK